MIKKHRCGKCKKYFNIENMKEIDENKYFCEKCNDEGAGSAVLFFVGIMLIIGGIFTIPFGLVGILIGYFLVKSNK